ncbi:MAG: type II toxin-antitoxin system RelE/ParE family toxin [Verrucomicrobia bacterium]|nr:type II toxin-antitoxin system RelE/ParE family toxin [Verrucomicrobiota bacterium]
MDFKIFLSDDALSDLERIVAYIAPHNPVAAERIGNQLLDAALSLRKFPERGRVVPEFKRPVLREIIFRSYRIIYRVNPCDQSLEIVRFWHGARGFPHIPRGPES